MNYTENYQLNQWVETDRVLMADFNTDNTKLDKALHTLSAMVAGNTESIDKLGNCKIEAQSYSGTGRSGTSYPTRITFSRQPLLFFILGQTQFMAGSKQTERGTVIKFESYGASVSAPYLTWSGNQVSFYGNDDREQLNSTGITYWVFALYAQDEK